MEPITKERLWRYIPLKIQTENHTERIARMKSQEQFPAARESDGSKHTPGASNDRMANAILHRMEVEDRLADKIAANVEEMNKIEAAISSLADTLEQEVLWMRYIDVDEDGQRLKWEEITERMYHNIDRLSTVKRLHGRALESIRKVEI